MNVEHERVGLTHSFSRDHSFCLLPFFLTGIKLTVFTEHMATHFPAPLEATGGQESITSSMQFQQKHYIQFLYHFLWKFLTFTSWVLEHRHGATGLLQMVQIKTAP